VTDRVLQGTLAVLGGVVIGLGVTSVLVSATGLLPEWIVVDNWLSPSVVALLVVFVGSYAFLGTRADRSGSSPQPLTEASPMSASAPNQLGTTLEASLDAPDATLVRTELGTAAITVLELRTGCSRRDAAEQLRDGTWTDDRIPAAMLSSEEGPSFGLGERLLAWLLPRRTLRRRAKRTITAIEAIQPGDLDGRSRYETATEEETRDRSELAASIVEGSTVELGAGSDGTSAEPQPSYSRASRDSATSLPTDADSDQAGQTVSEDSQSRRSASAEERHTRPSTVEDDRQFRRSSRKDDLVPEESSEGLEESLDA
jgi:hypothetical protein